MQFISKFLVNHCRIFINISLGPAAKQLQEYSVSYRIKYYDFATEIPACAYR